MRNGFTLIELILSLVIMGVLIGVAVPNLGALLQGGRLKMAADGLAQTMRYAQSKAVLQGQVYKVVLDGGGGSYRVEYLPAGQEHPDPVPVIQRWGRKHVIPQGMRLEGEKTSVEFFPDGTIDKARFILRQKDEAWVISTMEQRGYVSLFQEE